MRYAIASLAAAAVAIGALAGCDHPMATHTDTTVVKEPAPAVVEKDKETVVQREAPAAAPSTSTSVTVDASKPETTEASKTTTTQHVDTPMGSATRTETTRTTTQK